MGVERRRRPLRAGIVGAGLMGRWHGDFLRRAGGRVVAVLDRDPAAARALARRHAGATTPDPSSTWPAPGEVDVVHVCTPLAAHAAWVRRALEAGSHVVVEKPLAASCEEVRHLLDLAEQQGRLLVPVHQFPFQRGVRRLLARRRRLGTLLGVTFRAHTAGAEARPAAERQQVLREILPHPISLLCRLWAPGRADSLLPAASRWHVERADTSALVLTARAGDAACRCRIEIYLDRRPTRNEWILDGSRARGRADLYHGYGTVLAAEASRLQKILLPFREGLGTAGAAAFNLAVRTFRRQPAFPGLAELLAATYEAVRGGGRAPVDKAEILAVAELVDRCLTS